MRRLAEGVELPEHSPALTDKELDPCPALGPGPRTTSTPHCWSLVDKVEDADRNGEVIFIHKKCAISICTGTYTQTHSDTQRGRDTDTEIHTEIYVYNT